FRRTCRSSCTRPATLPTATGSPSPPATAKPTSSIFPPEPSEFSAHVRNDLSRNHLSQSNLTQRHEGAKRLLVDRAGLSFATKSRLSLRESALGDCSSRWSPLSRTRRESIDSNPKRQRGN